MKILMVCLGNICRSPLAEGILQKMVDEKNLDWKVDSAGTNGYHNGETPHKYSQKVALQNGIDISNQISRKITKNDIEEFDLIFAMAKDVMDDIKQIAGNKFGNKKITLFLDNEDVPDPWYGGEDGFYEVYKIIENRCRVLLEKKIS